MGTTGSVSHGFSRAGLITYPASAATADAMFEAALEAGADDVQSSDTGHEIYTSMDNLHETAKALEAKMGEAESAKLVWKPHEMVSVSEQDAGTLLRLLDALDDNDDVQNVYGNYAVSDEILAKLG
jgi:transcriptional/translational regulatory protein YebC/TACO1